MISKLYNDISIRRTQLKLTQLQLAARCGCSRYTIQAIELNKLKPSKNLRRRIEAALSNPGSDLDLNEWL